MATKESDLRNRAETGPTEDEIRQRAYEIYLARAGGQGDAMDDWLKAESELKAPTVPLQAAA
ncbi:MAG: DUF2934 domain-containing protein [Candidatus Korobacteraceae bacterium]